MPGLHIDRWLAGLNTNRAAISTPFRVSYGHPIVYKDALIDGSNVEITPANTLARRPGWTKYCSASYSGTANGIAGCDLNSTLHVLLSTSTNVYDVGTSTMTSIYSKGTTAQTFFQQVGNYEFFSDGNANLKWDGDTVTNSGIAAPTTAPTITNLNLYDTVGNTQTVHAWVPGYTYTNSTSSAQNYFLMAPTQEIYWTVIPKGTSLTSQSAAPNWSSQYGIVGGKVTDGQITWTNCGSLLTWKANTGSSLYQSSAFLAPGSFQSNKNTPSYTTSGSSVIGNWIVGDNGKGSVAYQIGTTGTGATNTLIATGFGFLVPTGATITGVRVSFAGACSYRNSISDNNIQLLKAGVPAGSNKAQGQYTVDVNNSLVIPSTARTYGSNTDLWGTTLTPSDVNNSGFGVQLTLNCNSNKLIGVAIGPINITVYYTISAADISGTTYASVILDSNNNLQRVKTLGTTGGSAPTWATTVGATTTDNTMTWECLGTGNQLPALFQWIYAYSFHTTSSHTSTVSPTLAVVAPIIGKNVPVTANGSSDTQCDRVDLYRTADGGSLLLYDASNPNVNASTSWTITDTALDTDLNALLVGPVAHANDPPPAGMTIITYHMGRLWGLVGNLLYFSAGPDCTNGDGMQAWPPANVFTLAAPGTGLVPTTQGLLVFTGIDVSAVLGGPQLQSFWLQPILQNVGVQSPNCITRDGDEVLIYTSQQQALSISANGKNEFGFNVAPTLAANFTAGGSYIAVHRAGQDQGVFLSDGSAKQIRFNMNAEAWDPIGTPVNGIGPLASIDTAIGTRRLLSAAGGFVLFRDTTTFSDAGSAYSAYATVGSVVLSEGGEKAVSVKQFVIQSNAVGSALTLSVLPNETSGSFTNIPVSNDDPWQLPASSTINQKTYQWLGVGSILPNIVRHLQIKITLPASDTVKNEIYTLSIN